MKFLAALGAVLFLLSLSAGSVGAGSLLRSRKLPGNNNVFSNAECFKSDPNIPGSLLAPPPNEALQQALEDLLNELYTCVQASSGGSTVYCDVYFNPHTGKYGESVESRNTVTVWNINFSKFHLFLIMCRPLSIEFRTAYSYYRNPSAVGVLRGQLCYNGTTTDGGNTHIFSVTEATSEIMDDLMRETGLQLSGGAQKDCINATYTELGPNIASAVAEVSWNGVTEEETAEITLLSSTMTLKKATTKDLRCKWCSGEFETVDGAALTCTEEDSDEDSEKVQFNNKESYSNLKIFGSHLHLGNNMTDGPPPVFFCKNTNITDEPLSPDAGAFPFSENPGLCEFLYDKEDCESLPPPSSLSSSSSTPPVFLLFTWSLNLWYLWANNQ